MNEILYRKDESYVSHHKTKQASMHMPQFSTQSNQLSKQPFSGAMKASMSI